MKRTCCVPACAFNDNGRCVGDKMHFYEYSYCVYHDVEPIETSDEKLWGTIIDNKIFVKPKYK